MLLQLAEKTVVGFVSIHRSSEVLLLLFDCSVGFVNVICVVLVVYAMVLWSMFLVGAVHNLEE